MGFITKAIPIVLAALSTVNGARILEAGPHAETIPNKYIVVMKKDVSEESFSAHTTWLSQTLNSRLMRRAGSSKPMAGMQNKYSLGGIFRAYSGEFDDAMIKDISGHDDV